MRHPFIWIVFFSNSHFCFFERTAVCVPLRSLSFVPTLLILPVSLFVLLDKVKHLCGVEGTGLAWCCKFQQTIFCSSSSLSFSLRSCVRVVSLRVWQAGVLRVYACRTSPTRCSVTTRVLVLITTHKTSVVCYTIFTQ